LCTVKSIVQQIIEKVTIKIAKLTAIPSPTVLKKEKHRFSEKKEKREIYFFFLSFYIWFYFYFYFLFLFLFLVLFLFLYPTLSRRIGGLCLR